MKTPAFGEYTNPIIGIGASALHANILRCIATGNAIEAARYTRSLVRHLRANGLIKSEN